MYHMYVQSTDRYMTGNNKLLFIDWLMIRKKSRARLVDRLRKPAGSLAQKKFVTIMPPLYIYIYKREVIKICR